MFSLEKWAKMDNGDEDNTTKKAIVVNYFCNKFIHNYFLGC